MAGFCLASDLGPSPSEREELERIIRSQAEQLQEAREADPRQSGGMAPQERQALVQLLSDLSKKVEDLKKLTEKQDGKIEDLQKANKALDKEIFDVREMAVCIIKDACARITAIEEKSKPHETATNLDHINALAKELLAKSKAGQKGVTYAEAATILKLDKSRICQLRSLIASDSRFNITWHPTRKNTKIICLKMMR